MSTERGPTVKLVRFKPRRTWRNTLVDVLVLLGMAALLVWLFSCVHQAANGTLHGAVWECRAPRGLAMAPASQGVVMGFAAMALCVWAWAASRKTRREDMWGGRAPLPKDPPLPPSPPPPSIEDPLALPATGMTHEDLRRIIGAMIAEADEAGGLIEAEMAGLGVETWEERLARARRCLRGVVLCLGNLMERIPEPVAAAKPVNLVIRWDGEAWRLGLERCRNEMADFVKVLAMRAAALRAYHSKASGYKPAHGGYGA